MPLPQNITKEHLLQAISKLDQEGIPKDGDSQYYDVIYKGKKYPPKLIVSYANLFANGEILDRKSFEGGENTPSFRLLENNDFNIEHRDMNTISFYPELIKFLDQAKTNYLKSSNYITSFQGLSVKVSFGQGNPARIPWVAFLKDNQAVQNGIYPAYLYFKQKDILVLAYGLSETFTPESEWNIDNAERISEYFLKNNLGTPERYGKSFIYKIYDTKKPLNENEINEDLNNIIQIYNQTLLSSPPKGSLPMIPNKFEPGLFFAAAKKSGLSITDNMALRFIASLLAKPFVILTGLSGSGKTKLAQAFAMWICEDENQYCMLPVGADWTNREPLLGFPNALKTKEYVKPDNGVLDLIIEANKNENQNKPYFLILDEMNLSHVERYFADFLSVMESKNKIALHSGGSEWNGVPAQIGFPKNLFIIGTVNIDETTYMFSPKVLDRASVIEFRVTAAEMESYLGGNSQINLKNLEGEGKSMAKSFVELAKDESLKVGNKDGLNKTLMSFFAELKKTGAEFGYRSASEILRFAAVANKLDTEWTDTDITDAAIMQKLLPKVHGSRRKLEPVLKTLGTLCLQDDQKMDDYISKSTIYFAENTKIKYPVSLEKILRMYQSLISNGFTSYAEA